MHKGVVHDEGPSDMAAGPRIGEIYLFAHGNEPIDVVLPFENGNLGEVIPYPRGMAVQLESVEDGNEEVAVVNNQGRVTVTGPADPEAPDVIQGLKDWIEWRRQNAQALGRSVLRKNAEIKGLHVHG